MGLEVLIPIFGILLVMVPVIGVTTILTLRFGLMPFMERLAVEMKNTGFAAPAALEERVDELTRELETVTAELHRLQEAQEFDRRLLESREEGSRGGTEARPTR